MRLIQIGANDGMHTIDDSVTHLAIHGFISLEDALLRDAPSRLARGLLHLAANFGRATPAIEVKPPGIEAKPPRKPMVAPPVAEKPVEKAPAANERVPG